MQAWQLGLQQGIQGAQASQKGSGQLDGAAGQAQTALVMEQLQRLGLFTDGDVNLNPGQLQGLMTMLSKQGEECPRLAPDSCMWCSVRSASCKSARRSYRGKGVSVHNHHASRGSINMQLQACHVLVCSKLHRCYPGFHGCAYACASCMSGRHLESSLSSD